jgi:5-methylcytosine-specific restriction endonuclease McrA
MPTSYRTLLDDKCAVSALVSGAESIKQILDKIGVTPTSKAYKKLRNACAAHNIQLPVFDVTGHMNRLHVLRRRTKPLSEYLVYGTMLTNNTGIKKRLIKEGVLENACVLCGHSGIWNGKPLSLQLDHKNGNRLDWRIENLRFLCPNCHSQTETFSGRKLRKHPIRQPNLKAYSRPQAKKFEIDRASLLDLVWSKPTASIAKSLGVSDSAISKRCRSFGITKPPRGYWQKVFSKSGVPSQI